MYFSDYVWKFLEILKQMSNFTLLQNNHEIFAHKSISSFKMYCKIRFFYLPLMCGKKELTCWRKGAWDFQGTAFWFWKKTAKLCNSVNVMCHKRDLQKLGKRGWPWTCPLTLNDAVFPCIKDSLPLFQVVISGRSQWKRENKYCTSLNITKACKNPEELGGFGLRVQLWLGWWQADFDRHGNYTFSLSVIKPDLFLSDSKMECLQLTMTEVLKRLNSKSKKGYNQVRETWLHSVGVVCGCWAREQKHFDLCKTFSTLINKCYKNNPCLRLHLIHFVSSPILQQLSITEVKVNKVQVCGTENMTFAVCLDQDEKKILQSVTR